MTCEGLPLKGNTNCGKDETGKLLKPYSLSVASFRYNVYKAKALLITVKSYFQNTKPEFLKTGASTG